MVNVGKYTIDELYGLHYNVMTLNRPFFKKGFTFMETTCQSQRTTAISIPLQPPERSNLVQLVLFLGLRKKKKKHHLFFSLAVAIAKTPKQITAARSSLWPGCANSWIQLCILTGLGFMAANLDFGMNGAVFVHQGQSQNAPEAYEQSESLQIPFLKTT